MIKKTLQITALTGLASLLLSSMLHADDSRYSPYYASRPCAYIEPCDCSDRFWGCAEYLYWKIQDSPESIPLVIEAPTNSTTAPILGSSGTSVVLGGKDIRTDWRSGGRFALGYWFDKEECLGGEVNCFFLPGGSNSQKVSSDGSINSALLAIPFYDVITKQERSTLLARPGIFSGRATLKLENRMFGAEANVIAPYGSFYGMDVTLLGGLRYWYFEEQLTFNTSSPFVNPPIDVYQTKDRFETTNNFYGGQMGIMLSYNCGPFFMNAKGKLAVGAMCGEVDIHGYLKTNDYSGDNNNFGPVEKYPGGYFTFPSNIGKHSLTRFAIVPEFNFNLGYQILDCVQIEVGYTCIYASNVLWAGKQLNRNFNISQTTIYTGEVDPVRVGKKSPRAPLKTEGLWVQGLNVGLIYQF